MKTVVNLRLKYKSETGLNWNDKDINKDYPHFNGRSTTNYDDFDGSLVPTAKYTNWLEEQVLIYEKYAIGSR